MSQPDLFFGSSQKPPSPARSVGRANALLIGHFANGMPARQLEANFKAGIYDGAHPAYLAEVFGARGD